MRQVDLKVGMLVICDYEDDGGEVCVVLSCDLDLYQYVELLSSSGSIVYHHVIFLDPC